MNNLKSGGTLFLAYEGRMGRANAPHSAHSGVLDVTEGSAPSEQTVTGLD